MPIWHTRGPWGVNYALKSTSIPFSSDVHTVASRSSRTHETEGEPTWAVLLVARVLMRRLSPKDDPPRFAKRSRAVKKRRISIAKLMKGEGELYPLLRLKSNLKSCLLCPDFRQNSWSTSPRYCGWFIAPKSNLRRSASTSKSFSDNGAWP